MVEGFGGNGLPNQCGVAGVAGVGGRHMGRRLARDSGAASQLVSTVMAGEACARCSRVVELDGGPRAAANQMAGITVICGCDVCVALAVCDFSIVAGEACAGDLGMINLDRRDGFPHRVDVTGFAEIGCRNVGLGLADSRSARSIVAGIASACGIGMNKGANRRPTYCGVAIIAGVVGGKVGLRLASGARAIMAGEAGSGLYGTVVEGDGRLEGCCAMARVAEVVGWQMRRRLANGWSMSAIMAGEALRCRNHRVCMIEWYLCGFKQARHMASGAII